MASSESTQGVGGVTSHTTENEEVNPTDLFELVEPSLEYESCYTAQYLTKNLGNENGPYEFDVSFFKK